LIAQDKNKSTLLSINADRFLSEVKEEAEGNAPFYPIPFSLQ